MEVHSELIPAALCDFHLFAIQDIMLFTWVQAQQKAMHTITVESACNSFKKQYGCVFGDSSIAALNQRYFRVRTGFIEAQKKTNESR